MVRSGVLGLGLLVWLAIPCWSFDASQPTKEEVDKKARELVRRLGDPHFRQREAAAHELLVLGSQSRNAIEAALNDRDIEIRESCRRLLPMALQADIKAKLRAFREDTEGTRQHELPGWKRWRTTVGFDADSRKFYGDMLQENIDLFQNLDTDADKTAGAYMIRCADLYSSLFNNNNRIMMINGGFQNTYVPPAQPKIHEFAALLFISSDEKVVASLNANGKIAYNNQLSALLQQSYIRTYFTSSPDGPVFKKLFFEWLDQLIRNTSTKSNGVGVQSINLALSAIQNNDLKEAIGFVEKVIAMKELMPHLRSTAMTTLGSIGDVSHAKLLQPYLTDSTTITTMNFGGANAKPITTQMRDVALGITIHLSGQKPAEFDFDGLKRNNWGNTTTFYYYLFGFEDDANRRNTFEKWNKYAKKNGKPTIALTTIKEEPKGEEKKAEIKK